MFIKRWQVAKIDEALEVIEDRLDQIVVALATPDPMRTDVGRFAVQETICRAFGLDPSEVIAMRIEFDASDFTLWVEKAGHVDDEGILQIEKLVGRLDDQITWRPENMSNPFDEAAR